MCDRENNYTKEFDDVVILDDVQNNYLDKFRILTDCPYDENIFIETDCLIYNDINVFWDYFKDATDFSTFGWNNGSLEPWFGNEIIDVIGTDKIPIFCPGYMYIRNGETCRKMYDDALNIIDYLSENREKHSKCFTISGAMRDDPVFIAIMVINNCTCAKQPHIGKCINLPAEKKTIYARISRGILNYGEGEKGGNLLHFSTAITKEGLYNHQIFVMNAALNGKWYAKLSDNHLVCIFFIIKSVIKNRSLQEIKRRIKKIIANIKKQGA